MDDRVGKRRRGKSQWENEESGRKDLVAGARAITLDQVTEWSRIFFSLWIGPMAVHEASLHRLSKISGPVLMLSLHDSRRGGKGRGRIGVGGRGKRAEKWAYFIMILPEDR